MELFIVFILGLICCIWSAIIAGRKNRSAFGWFVITGFLGIFGLLWIALLGSKLPMVGVVTNTIIVSAKPEER